MRVIFAFLFLLVSINVVAASVDTITIYSKAMRKNIKTVVVKPEGYEPQGTKKYPVVYLLHGYGGNYRNWITRVPQIQALADQHQLMIVCPDGAIGSWYFDSPIDSSYRYETFVSKEVPDFIDGIYHTIPERKGRVITGLSMGGHGGMFIGFRHADRFSGCGSMSGALHVSVITNGYDVEKRLGDTALNKKYWQDWSVLKVIEQYPKDSLSIIIDCGIQDRIIGMSRAAHDKLMKLNVPHDYIERPGGHDWPYWRTAIDYQLLFFRKHFDKMLK
jgi:S-formylglutathione hydrolase FrmB